MFTRLCTGILTISILLVSCRPEEPKISIIPAITFSEFKKFGPDSATCKINFIDGDGDVGLDPSNTAPPFNSTSAYNSDLFLVYYFQDPLTKTWSPVNLNSSDTNKLHFDTLQLKFRIPNLTQNGQKKAIQGEIKVRLGKPYGIPGQTFKYKISIFDRALHHSNEVETGSLTYP
jgi:hypothetical protein